MCYERIDQQKISHNEGYNEGYSKGFQDGFKTAYSKYINPGSVWIEMADIHDIVSYHCSNCGHRVTEKVDICPGCFARMHEVNNVADETT